MSTYEIEHNIPAQSTTTNDDAGHEADDEPHRRSGRPRMPDLSSFWSALSAINTSTTRNPHAVPTPADVAGAYRLLADALMVMWHERYGRRYATRADDEAGAGATAAAVAAAAEASMPDQADRGRILTSFLENILSLAESPPRRVRGCSQEFLDALDRVPKKALKATDTCPICSSPFLEDEYPLVVRLPCHETHRFDLECITPWLKLHPTCPLDRTDLLAKDKTRGAGAGVRPRGRDGAGGGQDSTTSEDDDDDEEDEEEGEDGDEDEDEHDDDDDASEEELDEIDSMYL